jgi:uncharacterized protein
MKVIIFKPIEACNSNCVYCDVVKKGIDTVMSREMLELTFQRINEFLVAFPDEEIQLIWHGGEPCLLQPDYFKQAMDFQSKHCNTVHERIKHAIQSNLTLITQDHIDVFRSMGIETIGSSYDPEPNVCGPGKHRDSESYNSDFFRGIRLLEANKLSWGLIYVITRKSLEKPLQLFYFLTNIKLGAGPCLNPVKLYSEDTHGLSLKPQEIADWYGTIYTEWYKHRDRYPHVRPFESLTRSIENNELSLGCEDSGACAYKWAYIGPGGETSQCGRSGDYNLLSYGNLREKTLEDIFTDKKRDLIMARNEILMKGPCKDCRFWGICHGGCPLDAFIQHNDFNNKYINCSAKKQLIEKYIEPITGKRAEFYHQPVN